MNVQIISARSWSGTFRSATGQVNTSSVSACMRTFVQAQRIFGWCIDDVDFRDLDCSERWQDRRWQILGSGRHFGGRLRAAPELYVRVLCVEAPQTALSVSQEAQ
jgi:hypothetical protein